MPSSSSKSSKMWSSLHSSNQTLKLRKIMVIKITLSNKKRNGPYRQQIKPKSNPLISSLSNSLLNLKIIIHNHLKISTRHQHHGHPSNLQHSHPQTTQITISSRYSHEEKKQIHRYQKIITWSHLQSLHEKIINH